MADCGWWQARALVVSGLTNQPPYHPVQFTSSHHLGHYKVSTNKCQIAWTPQKRNFNEPSWDVLNLLKFLTNIGRLAKPLHTLCSRKRKEGSPLVFSNQEVISFGREIDKALKAGNILQMHQILGEHSVGDLPHTIFCCIIFVAAKYYICWRQNIIFVGGKIQPNIEGEQSQAPEAVDFPSPLC